MTVTIELPPERAAALKAQARARGLSLEQWLLDLACQHAPAEPEDHHKPDQPFWKTFTDRMHSLPAEVFRSLPTDGASEHDHYLYGSPKR